MLVAGMKDSVLRDSIKLLVADQMKKYTARIATQNELLKDIDVKQMTLEGSAPRVENRAHVTCNRSISTGAFAGDKPAGRFYQATGASHRCLLTHLPRNNTKNSVARRRNDPCTCQPGFVVQTNSYGRSNL